MILNFTGLELLISSQNKPLTLILIIFEQLSVYPKIFNQESKVPFHIVNSELPGKLMSFSLEIHILFPHFAAQSQQIKKD